MNGLHPSGVPARLYMAMATARHKPFAYAMSSQCGHAELAELICHLKWVRCNKNEGMDKWGQRLRSGSDSFLGRSPIGNASDHLYSLGRSTQEVIGGRFRGCYFPRGFFSRWPVCCRSVSALLHSPLGTFASGVGDTLIP